MDFEYCECCGDLFFEEDLILARNQLVCKNCKDPLRKLHAELSDVEEE